MTKFVPLASYPNTEEPLKHIQGKMKMRKIFIISNFNYLETDSFRPVHLYFLFHKPSGCDVHLANSWFSLDLRVYK